MISDDDTCVTTMLIMMKMQMMKMDNEDGNDDDNKDDDEDHNDGDVGDDATFAILCYSDRARLVACQSVSCPRAPGHDCQKPVLTYEREAGSFLSAVELTRAKEKEGQRKAHTTKSYSCFLVLLCSSSYSRLSASL